MPNICLYYYVRLDQDKWPISGTQQGFSPAVSLPCGQPCQWVKLQTKAYTAPSGTVQVFHPNGNRWFYKLDRQGNIVPNSFIMSNHFPQSPGSCGYYIEWKRYSN